MQKAPPWSRAQVKQTCEIQTVVVPDRISDTPYLAVSYTTHVIVVNTNTMEFTCISSMCALSY